MPLGSPPQESAPLTAPPAWWLDPERGEPGPGNEASIPGEGWPEQKTVEYLVQLLTLMVLLLALPWLFSKALYSPTRASRAAAKAAPGAGALA